MAETTTLRVREVFGSVTVYVAPGLAPPALVKIALVAPLICRPLERLMRPALVVPEPVQIVPAHETVRNRMLVPDTWAQTLVFCEIGQLPSAIEDRRHLGGCRR